MKGDTHRNDYLKLMYNATAIANVADNAASSPLTNVKAALHTTWPGTSATQATNACTYGTYAQVNVPRSGSGFTVSNNDVTLAAEVTFPEAGAGASDEAAFFSFGDGTKIWHKGALGGYAPVAITGAVSDVVMAPGHGLSVGDKVAHFPAFDGSLPTGITEGAILYVKTAPDADTYTLSTTNGGATLNITAAGVGYVQRVKPITITEGVRPVLKTGTTVSEF